VLSIGCYKCCIDHRYPRLCSPSMILVSYNLCSVYDTHVLVSQRFCLMYDNCILGDLLLLCTCILEGLLCMVLISEGLLYVYLYPQGFAPCSIPVSSRAYSVWYLYQRVCFIYTCILRDLLCVLYLYPRRLTLYCTYIRGFALCILVSSGICSVFCTCILGGLLCIVLISPRVCLMYDSCIL
jgi:hypothetical protein